MPPVEVIAADRDLTSYNEVTIESRVKIRFTRQSEYTIDENVLLETILTDLTPEFADYAPEVINYIMNNFNVPKEISFSETDSKKLLQDVGFDGNKVTLLPGEYPIIVNDENPYGYYEIDIIIQ